MRMAVAAAAGPRSKRILSALRVLAVNFLIFAVLAELVGNSPTTIHRFYNKLAQKTDLLREAAKGVGQ